MKTSPTGFWRFRRAEEWFVGAENKTVMPSYAVNKMQCTPTTDTSRELKAMVVWDILMLHKACLAHDYATVNFLLTEGIDPDAVVDPVFDKPIVVLCADFSKRKDGFRATVKHFVDLAVNMDNVISSLVNDIDLFAYALSKHGAVSQLAKNRLLVRLVSACASPEAVLTLLNNGADACDALAYAYQAHRILSSRTHLADYFVGQPYHVSMAHAIANIQLLR